MDKLGAKGKIKFITDQYGNAPGNFGKGVIHPYRLNTTDYINDVYEILMESGRWIRADLVSMLARDHIATFKEFFESKEIEDLYTMGYRDG